ncbi:MAG: nitrous oxide-stimulated promoter family protein [Nitrososphaerota archaeon]|nr:nitrous oxide-stimulated promoter family protein [Nitrososphaerota archaeon]
MQCYKPDMKLQARKIMSYSGPRLLLRHPILALHHLWDKRRKAPTLTTE